MAKQKTPQTRTSSKKKKEIVKIIHAARPTPEQTIEIQKEIDKQQRVKKRGLTTKEIMFIRGIVSGKTKRQSAIDAGYTGTNEVVSVTASQVLNKPNVKEALQQSLKKHGLTVDSVVQVIAEGMQASKVEVVGKGEDAFADVMPDHNVRLRAGAMAAKYIGMDEGDEDKNKGGNTYIFNQQNNLNGYMK